MLQSWIEHFVKVLGNLKHLPAAIRISVELVRAQAEAARGDFSAAERRLVRIYGLAPQEMLEHSTTNLLMALVALRLGNPGVAADLAPSAVSHVGCLRVSANGAERAYLSYAGRLIFEEATEQLGAPKTLNVGVEFDDLDVRRVRGSLRAAYPVYRPRREVSPHVH